MEAGLDLARVKADFPILSRRVNGKRLVYLDSASSSQKPQSVLDAMDEQYRTYYANIHRGVYTIAEESTARYELARAKTARFLGAANVNEVVFTKNITEAINLFAHSWGRTNLDEGDAIVVTEMEHHANIVPWHMLCAERGVELRWVPIDHEYRLDLSELDRLLDGAKLFAFTAMSNVLGTVQRRPLPRRRRARRRRHGARRRRASGAARFGRRAGVGRRFRGVHRAQDARTERHRRLLGPRRPARGNSPVPRWRGDDPRRAQRRLRPQRGAMEVRGRHDAHRRGHRARRGHRLPRSPRHGRGARARAQAHRSTRCARSTTASASASTFTARVAPTCAAGSSPSGSTASMHTTSRRCSTKTPSACARAITAPSP